MYINLKNFNFYSTTDKSGNTAIKNVILSNSSNVKHLNNDCFNNCSNLSSINIPTSVKSLGDFCFDECSNLLSIIIPTSVKSLGAGCFKDINSDIHFNILTSDSNEANRVGNLIKSSGGIPSGAIYYYKINDTWTIFTPS